MQLLPQPVVKWLQNGNKENADEQGTATKFSSDPQAVTRCTLRRAIRSYAIRPSSKTSMTIPVAGGKRSVMAKGHRLMAGPIGVMVESSIPLLWAGRR